MGGSALLDLLQLLRWHKPSGRLILLIPAGWALWLHPGAPPPAVLVGWIVLGGLAVSGAGCVANDLWDRRIDPLVERTRERPLASGRVGIPVAVALLVGCLAVALLVVLALPAPARWPSLLLAIAALPPILLYPSAKRWFPFPQLVLAFCWGFAVLIPWVAASGYQVETLTPGGLPQWRPWSWPLSLTWLAAVVWTFGFDTVYAMADREDDRALGVRSSALSLGAAAPVTVAACYAITCLALATALLLSLWQAHSRPSFPPPLFWLPWLVASLGMQREAALLRRPGLPRSAFGRHFSRQVQLGALLLLALVLARTA